jgi:phosphonate transport system substrate-binding protein
MARSARERRCRQVVRAVSIACLGALTVGQAAAGWRDDMKSFRIGIVAADGGHAVAGLSTIKRAFADALGVPVDVLAARDWAALIDAEAAGRVDYAIDSTAAYATTALLCSCVEPVVAPVGEDGTTGIVAVLVTREGKLAGLADLAGHRVAVAPPDSLAGSMLPAVALAPQAIASGDEPYLVRAESASAAEAMLITGSVDAIFGWAPARGGASGEVGGGTIDRLVAAGLDRAELSVVWTSPPLRYGPHALRTGIDPEVRTILVDFLTRLKSERPDVYDLLERDHGGGFVAVSAADYAAALDAVRLAAAGK